MDVTFWIERWSRHEIGFHQREVNEYLMRYWPALELPAKSLVFVPLCGKSLDMRWLRQMDYRVLGIDIAQVACREFFEEWDVTPTVTHEGKFEQWFGPDVTLLCGDFFDLQAHDLVDVAAVFDRAALIALPPAVRKRYVQTLRNLLPKEAPILLIAPDYDQHEMQGPPFAVGIHELQALFAGCDLEELAAVDVTNALDNARFRQRGLTRLIERVIRIEGAGRA